MKRAFQLFFAFGVAITSGCQSFEQVPDQAMYRAPGARLLDESVDVGIPARLHWQYAWLSVASYDAFADTLVSEDLKPNDRKKPVSVEIEGRLTICQTPEVELRNFGWKLIAPVWPAPGDPIYAILKATHTRVQVWENKSQKTLAVTFGGTENWVDWLSNFRWFIPKSEDEYSIVATQFTKAFAHEFKRRASLPGGAYLRDMKIRATGHSLGGGLAQQFAYALPADPEGIVPRVTRVYAFNSSPVTGHGDIEEETLAVNVKGMRIDRIYERGEFLAGARALTSLFLVPSAHDPAIRGVRYMFFWKSLAGAVSSHSISSLACHLQHSKDRPIPIGQQLEED